jgi:cytochrome b subunit of formate dehydrogenase
MADKKQPSKLIHLAILKQMLTLTTSGFGLVAALAWNSVIQEFVTTQIKPFLPKGSGLWSLIIYAIVVTTLAVSITIYLSRVIKKLES